VLEMPDSGSKHHHVMLITVVNAFLILDGTSGLNDGPDSSLIGNLNAVGKREECIGSHHRALKVKPKGFSLNHRLFKRINPGGLTTSHADHLLIFCQHYRV